MSGEWRTAHLEQGTGGISRRVSGHDEGRSLGRGAGDRVSGIREWGLTECRLRRVGIIQWLALVGAGLASGACDASPVATAEAAPSVDRIVFVSSATFSGAIGGVPTADQTCSDLAAAARLVGTYRAWLSDDAGRSPSVTFTPPDAPFVMISGVRVADHWADLTDGMIVNQIVIDEQGNQPATVPVVWTGTDPSGQPASSCATCRGWSAASGVVSGQVVVFDAIGTGWSASLSAPCNQLGRLYCFEQ